jgi:hypothetical protein
MGRLLHVALAGALVLALGCEYLEGDSPTEPADEDATEVGSVAERLSGSFGLGETSSHEIGIGASGTVEVTLTSLEPLATLTVGLLIGTVDDSTNSCTTLTQDSSIRTGETLSQSVVAGVHCVSVFDVGNVPSNVIVTYTIDVTIPGQEAVSETFSGSFGIGETSCHDIALAEEGSAEMRLTSLEPLATRTVGMGIGTRQGSEACALLAEDRDVSVGEVLLATELDAGAYCTCVFDVGNVFPDERVSYTLAVQHR